MLKLLAKVAEKYAKPTNTAGGSWFCIHQPKMPASLINKDVDTERIFEKGYTSKTDDNKNHGIGLWEVRKILSNNNNLNLFTTKDDNLFTQQLEIYF